MIKKIFLIIFLGGLLLPSVSLAVSYNTYKADGKTVIYEGLVPCGNEVCIYSGKAVESFLEYLEFFKVKFPESTFEENCEKVGVELSEWKSIPCQFCHFFVMFKGILDFVLKLVIVIGVLMLVIAGFLMLVAYGGPLETLTGGQKGGPVLLSRAKKIINSTIIGLVIIFAAWIIINTIFTWIGLSDFALKFTGPGKWFTIDCPIKPFEEKEEGVAPEEEEEVAPEEEKKEKIYRCGECGAGLHICNEKQCLALGDSEKPCQYTPAWKGAWYGYCEPKPKSK